MDTLEQISTFLELIDLPAVLVRVTGKDSVVYEKLSPALEQLTGLSTKDIIGRSPHDILPASVADAHMENYLACIRTKRSFCNEGQMSFPTGKDWWSMKFSPIIKNETLIGIIGFPTLITPRKDEKRKFASALREIQRVNSDLKVLSSTAAHDLRGPLRQAKLVNQLLLDKNLSSSLKAIELVNLGDEILTKALKHIDDSLTNLTAPQNIKVEDSIIDVKAWCHDVTLVLDPLSQLRFHAPQLTIECEQFVIDIVLRNLLDNAFKYAISKIKLGVESDGEHLIFTVEDDGRGFNRSAFPHNTALTANHAPAQSTGIGLSSSISLIEQRGGHIWLNTPSRQYPGGSVSFSMQGQVFQQKSRNVA